MKLLSVKSSFLPFVDCPLGPSRLGVLVATGSHIATELLVAEVEALETSVEVETIEILLAADEVKATGICAPVPEAT